MTPKSSKVLETIQNLRLLLDELESQISLDSQKKHGPSERSREYYKGASGGVRMLLEKEGYFKEPKSLSEVVVRLRQEGFNYPRNTVSMVLLRAVRNRILVRLPAEGSLSREKWVYVIRK